MTLYSENIRLFHTYSIPVHFLYAVLLPNNTILKQTVYFILLTLMDGCLDFFSNDYEKPDRFRKNTVP